MHDRVVDFLLWFFAFGCILGPVAFAFLFVYLLFTEYFFLPIAYVAYLFIDRHSPHQGGWKWRPLNTWSLAMYVLPEYFPCRCVGTTSLKAFDSANKNYIAGIHPHGHIPLSSIVGVCANESVNFLKRTGLRLTGTTHDATFLVPVVREIFMAFGSSAASSKGIDHLLSGREGMGNLVGVYPGGARECSLAEPKTCKLILKNRMGFVRKALENGADLVPCVSFGDNEVFYKRSFKKGTFMHKLQDFLIRKSIPILSFYGIGFLNVLPRRIPLNLVIGAPISVDKTPSPTLEQIKSLHATYVRELVALYESQKANYGYEDVPIELL